MWFKPLGSKGYHKICMKEETCLRHLDRKMWRPLNYITKYCLQIGTARSPSVQAVSNICCSKHTRSLNEYWSTYDYFKLWILCSKWPTLPCMKNCINTRSVSISRSVEWEVLFWGCFWGSRMLSISDVFINLIKGIASSY